MGTLARFLCTVERGNKKKSIKIIYTFRSSMLETFGISTKDLKNSVVQAGATFLDIILTTNR